MVVEIQSYENSVINQLLVDQPQKWDMVLQGWMSPNGYASDAIGHVFDVNYIHLDETNRTIVNNLWGAALYSKSVRDRVSATQKLFDTVQSNCYIHAISNTTFKYAYTSKLAKFNFYNNQHLYIEEMKYN